MVIPVETVNSTYRSDCELIAHLFAPLKCLFGYKYGICGVCRSPIFLLSLCSVVIICILLYIARTCVLYLMSVLLELHVQAKLKCPAWRLSATASTATPTTTTTIAATPSSPGTPTTHEPTRAIPNPPANSQTLAPQPPPPPPNIFEK